MTMRNRNNVTDPIFPYGLWWGRRENNEYLRLIDMYSINEMTHKSVFDAYSAECDTKLFRKPSRLQAPSQQDMIDIAYIKKYFKVFADHWVKSYSLKTIWSLHKLKKYEAKEIISWFRRYVRRNLKFKSRYERRRQRVITRQHITCIKNYMEENSKKNIRVNDIRSHISNSRL